jgi:prophage regulatory protein
MAITDTTLITGPFSSKRGHRQDSSNGATAPQRPYIRVHEILAIVPFSAATIWRKSANGTFPKPIKLSERVTAWSRKDVESWLTEKETA